MHSGKKLFLIFLASALLCAQFAAQEQDYNQGLSDKDTVIPIKFHQNAEFALGFNTMQGYEPSPVSASFYYNIFGNRFSAAAGTKLEKGDTQLTISGSYKFFKHTKVSLGTGIVYNLDWLHDFSLSNNFLPSLFIIYTPNDFYSLKFDADFFFKFRNVFALSDDLSSLINATMAFSLRNEFSLPKDISLYFEFASIERFRYMILCAPSFIFGGRYSAFEHFDLTLEAAIRYIDFFTLSAHYDDTEIRIGASYKW